MKTKVTLIEFATARKYQIPKSATKATIVAEIVRQQQERRQRHRSKFLTDDSTLDWQCMSADDWSKLGFATVGKPHKYVNGKPYWSNAKSKQHNRPQTIVEQLIIDGKYTILELLSQANKLAKLHDSRSIYNAKDWILKHLSEKCTAAKITRDERGEWDRRLYEWILEEDGEQYSFHSYAVPPKDKTDPVPQNHFGSFGRRIRDIGRYQFSYEELVVYLRNWVEERQRAKREKEIEELTTKLSADPHQLKEFVRGYFRQKWTWDDELGDDDE